MRLKGLRERVQLLEQKKGFIEKYTDEYFQNMLKLMDESHRGGERPGAEVFEDDKPDFSLPNNHLTEGEKENG